jgi:hypothetical protein
LSGIGLLGSRSGGCAACLAGLGTVAGAQRRDPVALT